MPTRYVNPRNDLIFKRIFGDHPELLRSFLNALLPLPEDAPIESLEYLPCEQIPEAPWRDKTAIVDVKCRDVHGRIFLVEMQMLWSNSFQQRVLFEASHAYIKQLKVGVNYNALQPVYALALTNTVFVPHSERYNHHYQFVCVHDTKQVIKGMEFVFVEIPKFKPTTAVDKRITVLWMRFMSEVGTESEQTIDPELANHPLIGQALKITEQASLSEAELEVYRAREDRARLEGLYALDARAEGKIEGKAEGKFEGKAESLKRLLARKFGPLHPGIQTKIDAASLEEIDTWFDAGIDAVHLDSVFAR
jgi:predicted transposase/invertase (TIGR01784 family)